MKKTIYSLSILSLGFSACQPKIATNSPEVNSTASTNSKSLISVDPSDMDLSVRPQDDFFQFANGTWCKNNPVPSTESRWGSFNELENRNNKTLKQILHTAAEISDKTPGSQEQILGDYYLSFTDMNTRNKLGSTPLIQRLESIKTIKSKSELVDAIAKCHQVGIRTLFSFYVGQNLNKVSENIVYISQGGLGLPNRDYYLSENKKSIKGAYSIYIQKAFTLVGENQNVEAIANDIIGFETALAEASMTPAEQRIPELTNNVLSEQEAEKLFPKFDFESYQKKIGCESFDSLIVEQPNFMKQINVLIDKSSLESWKNYLSWCVINYYSKFLDTTWANLHFDFYNRTMSGTNEMKPIDERCIQEITDSPIS